MTRHGNAPAGLDGLLARLDGVKRTGPGKYIARCPVASHNDKSPSLSIAESGDRVLLHCFSGCATSDVLQAIGLEMRDLFNEPLPAPERRKRAVAASRRDLEAALDHELTVLALTLGQRVLDRQGRRDTMPEGWAPLPAGHWEREVQSARRVLALIPQVYAEVA